MSNTINIRMLLLSDFHVRSEMPKKRVDTSGFSLKEKVVKSFPFTTFAENFLAPAYNAMFNANVKPHVQANKFKDWIPRILRIISRLKPDVVLINGDFFDLSRTTYARDRKIQGDTEEVFKRFISAIEEINIPVIVLPGNADALYPEQMKVFLKKIKESGANGWDALDKTGKIKILAVNDEHCNFALRINDSLVVGLNSVEPNEFGFSDDTNLGFLNSVLYRENGGDNLTPVGTPVAVITHHAPFKVLSKEIGLVLGGAKPAQTWLVSKLDDYCRTTRQPAIIGSGHVHTSYDKVTENGLAMHITKPLSLPDKHIGSLIGLGEGRIEVKTVGYGA